MNLPILARKLKAPYAKPFEVGVVELQLRTDTHSALLTIRKPAS